MMKSQWNNECYTYKDEYTVERMGNSRRLKILMSVTLLQVRGQNTDEGDNGKKIPHRKVLSAPWNPGMCICIENLYLFIDDKFKNLLFHSRFLSWKIWGESPNSPKKFLFNLKSNRNMLGSLLDRLSPGSHSHFSHLLTDTNIVFVFCCVLPPGSTMTTCSWEKAEFILTGKGEVNPHRGLVTFQLVMYLFP